MDLNTYKRAPLNRLAALTLLSGGALAITAMPAHANPTGGTVTSGAATFDTSVANQLNVNQTTDKAIINWETFNIAAGETTTFNQPGANSVTLNRIGDVNPSEILGTLNANGHLMLVNPNGLMIGSGAQVNVASLVATTADIEDADFESGNYVFSRAGAANAQVVNEGDITIASGGFAALVAPTVINDGTINANAGKVALHGGDVFTLDPYGDTLVNFALPADRPRSGPEADAATVTHGGAIYADAGSVRLSAKAAKAVVDSAINMDGIVQAQTVANVNGKIILSADRVDIAGTLDASGATAGQSGGSIEAKGAKTLAFTGNATTAGNDAGANGGTVTLHGQTIALGGTVDSGAGAGGTAGTNTFTAGGTFTVADAEASTIESSMASGAHTRIGAHKNVEVNADIDTGAQTNGAALHVVDTNADGILNANLRKKITLGENQSLNGDANRVTVHSKSSVQNGVDVAADGATVTVYSGNFHENVKLTADNLTLQGNNAGIEAGEARRAESTIHGYVEVGGGTGNGAVVDGFKVKGGTDDKGVKVGVRVKSVDGVTVKNTIVDGSGDIGVNVHDAHGTAVTGNSVKGFAKGVAIKSSDRVLVENNRIAASTGVESRNSDFTQVFGNTLEGNGAGETGVSLIDAQQARVRYNEVGGYETGVNGRSSNYANIRDNTITGVKNGIAMNASNRAFIKNNFIDGTGVAEDGTGISLKNSDKARVFTNRVRDMDTGIAVNHSNDATIDRNRVLGVDKGITANYADTIVAGGNRLVAKVPGAGTGMTVKNTANADIDDGNTITDFYKDVVLVNTTLAF